MWGTIWNFTLLVWTKPQWDAKRVDIRRKQRANGNPHGTFTSHESPRQSEVEGDSDAGTETHSSTSRSSLEQGGRSLAQHAEQQTSQASSQTHEQKVHRVSSSNLRKRNLASRELHTTSDTIVKKPNEVPADTTVPYAEQEFEYYWQSYPEDGPFLTRLDWAFDIVSTFRMTGECRLVS